MVVLGGGAVSYERGTPVGRRFNQVSAPQKRAGASLCVTTRPCRRGPAAEGGGGLGVVADVDAVDVNQIEAGA